MACGYPTRVTPRPAPAQSRRRLGAAVLALAAPLTLGACQLASPLTTDQPYNPADGVSVRIGPVEVVDLLIVSEGSGAPGTVTGLVANAGEEPVTVLLTTPAGQLQPAVEVPPQGRVRLDGMLPGQLAEPVTVPAVDVIAGATLPVQVAVEAGVTTQAQVPVLLPRGPYAEYSPAAQTSTPDDASQTTSP